MLYDPKWQKPSIESFIGWLETQPARKQYDFNNCRGECLLGQYMTAMGIQWGVTPPSIVGDWRNTSYVNVANNLFGPLRQWTVLSEQPWTFGAALARARELQSHQV